MKYFQCGLYNMGKCSMGDKIVELHTKLIRQDKEHKKELVKQKEKIQEWLKSVEGKYLCINVLEEFYKEFEEDREHDMERRKKLLDKDCNPYRCRKIEVCYRQ